jgi:transcription antitermination protein NusB
MASARELRRLAFQALFQLDARGVKDAREIREAIEPLEEYTTEEKDRAFELAVGAYDDREAADRAMQELAPTWPAHRQAAVDRAILRLAHFEMTSGRTHPKIAVNEAVELAKEFSTDRSPAFVNGLLDKVLKRVLAQGRVKGEPEPQVEVRTTLAPPAGEPRVSPE